jgi:hypothetical protein
LSGMILTFYLVTAAGCLVLKGGQRIGVVMHYFRVLQ